jgi:hypothetical protein
MMNSDRNINPCFFLAVDEIALDTGSMKLITGHAPRGFLLFCLYARACWTRISVIRAIVSCGAYFTGLHKGSVYG